MAISVQGRNAKEDPPFELEASFRHIFNSAVDAIFLLDVDDDRIVDANDAACNLLGYSREKLRSLKITDIHEHELERLRTFADGLRRFGRITTEAMSCRANSGALIPVEIMATQFAKSDSSGPAVRTKGFVLAFVRDISGSKEKSRCQEIAAFESFAIENPMPVLRIDLAGVIEFCNTAARTVFNVGEGDRLMTAWRERILGDGDVNAGQCEIEESCRSYRVSYKESTIPGRVNIYCHDITELKAAQDTLAESEERFRHLVENITDIFYVIEFPGNKLAYVSPAFDEIFGRSCSLLGGDPRAFLDSIHPDDREYVEKRLEQIKLGPYNAEFRVVRPDGSIRWIWDRSFPIRDENGELRRVVGIGEDVTTRRNAEQRLKRAERKLVANEKLAALGRFSAGIAHEINQPLMAIQGYAENAGKFLEKNRPGEVRQNLAVISDQVRRIKDIIENIRLLARKPSGNLQTIMVGDVIRGILSVVGARIKLQNCRVVHHDEKKEISIVGDLVRLEQVLLNVISNALDELSEREGAELEIEVKEDEKSTVIYIRDNGPGIPPSIIDEIFEPFVTSKPVGKGMGLGLSISRSLIDQMNGTMKVRNRESGGAEFSISLPKGSTRSTEERN